MAVSHAILQSSTLTSSTTHSPSTTTIKSSAIKSLITRLPFASSSSSSSYNHHHHNQQPIIPPSSQPWPEHPFPLIHTTGYSSTSHSPVPEAHFCIHAARLMALTHNTIFRALNAIHAQSLSPGLRRGSALILPFREFILVTCEFITNHHVAEERAFFPGIEDAAAGVAAVAGYDDEDYGHGGVDGGDHGHGQRGGRRKGLMSENVEQHRALEADLERLQRWALAVGRWEFDGRVLRGLVEGLAGSLGGHMREEIGCILELHRWVPSSVLRVCYERMHDEAAGGMSKWKSGPFVFMNQDADFLLDGERIPFPEIPAPVPYAVPAFIIEQVVARRHPGAWRFCPSSAYGRPRPCTGYPSAAASSWSSPSSLLGLGPGPGGGLGWWWLIGWLMAVVFLAWEFGAYVRAIP